jgi:hypothetical protein
MIDPMWVSTGDLASSVMPSGELSTTVAEIGIVVLQVDCPKKKIIFPWIVTVYLLERRFNSRILQKHFRMDDKYKLSHQNLVNFFCVLYVFRFVLLVNIYFNVSLTLVFIFSFFVFFSVVFWCPSESWNRKEAMWSLVFTVLEF